VVCGPGACPPERAREDEVVGVEEWTEVRRLHVVRGLLIREIHCRTAVASRHDPSGDRQRGPCRAIGAR
jgi:hypothetical protein